MPIFDFFCEECKKEKEIIVMNKNEEIQICCGKNMKKLVSKGTKFKLIYDNRTDMCDWDGNKSRYWDAFNKARAEGKDVVPAHEVYKSERRYKD